MAKLKKIVLFLTLTVCSLGLSKSKIKNLPQECDSSNYVKPILTENYSLKDLDNQFLVARRVLHAMEKNSRPIYQVETSFDTGLRRLVCATSDNSLNMSSSVYLPTLIALNPGSGFKNSIWQFHSNITNGVVGVWNQKSRISSAASEGDGLKVDGWEKSLQDQGIAYKIISYNRNMVQFQFSRTKDQVTEIVYITFDLVNEL